MNMECSMTRYEELNKKKMVLLEQVMKMFRSGNADIASIWYQKYKELKDKINKMTIEEAERDTNS